MINLNELAESIETGAISVGGRSVEVRALTATEHALLLVAMPKPRPPMVKDPARGSAAPRIPGDDDPKYLLELESWYALLRAATVGVACRVQLDDQPWPLTLEKVFIVTLAGSLLDRLPLPMIERLYRAQQRLARGQTAEEEHSPAGAEDENPTTPG